MNSELFRARRLVLNGGLHAKRWTRQQTINYGISPSEVDRYVVFPGQACSCLIGALKLFDLRDEAKRELGKKFALTEFHSLILDLGDVPISILQEYVAAYIRETSAKQ